MKECANCVFLNDYGVCECNSGDKWYACPIENKKPENIQALKRMQNGRHNMRVNGWQKGAIRNE